MRSFNRKTTPRVKRGRVQKKNNWTETADYFNTPQKMPVIDRKRPGKGYRHVLKRRDLESFITLLPNWDELSKGLNAIVLAPGEWGADGYHCPLGVVEICAWEADMWIDYKTTHYESHRPILDRLGVESEKLKDGVLCKWTAPQVRAYQLLHVLTSRAWTPS
jgi:hypothetical protein